MALNPFVWSQGGQKLSASEVQRQRQIAQALAQANTQTPKDLGEGLNAIGRALAFNAISSKASEAEKMGREAFSAQLAKLGPDASMQDIVGGLDNDWASPGGSAYASALLGRELDESDPVKQLMLQQAQLDYQQDLAGPAAEGFTLGEGQVRYGADGKPIARGPDKTPDTMVTTNVGGSDKFYENLDKELGTQVAQAIDAGRNAASNNARLSALEQHLSNAPQGAAGAAVQFAGSLGIPIEGLDDVQAAQAIINQMVPGQRPPGSGTMSDADLILFKQSLPAIINQPGGNAKIIETTKAINDYTIAQATIAQQVANREISPAEGRERQAAIPNPLAGIGKGPDSSTNENAVTITRPNGKFVIEVED
jgi:hypothetical protein